MLGPPRTLSHIRGQSLHNKLSSPDRKRKGDVITEETIKEKQVWRVILQ